MFLVKVENILYLYAIIISIIIIIIYTLTNI